ncbi:hypothetical protein PPO02_07405 [Proteus mirabilis]|uniref:hypothetical protein n=1 Tax=Proteus mirabilis TaxID=584 RepID=UPI002349E13D|nr:hypothetical protein [Proteus mirabilis]MDC5894539.1 hypothetical protein [Proteus mirabilis]MDC5915673.1 hypothetical protein [Proteus mirabilis]MDC5926189.1 hypothetical protein [Proteus mirabilis]MDC6011175.1 hypothetical protein [Proteus mirabilis]MDC6021748.1 hypothetical protein [Proteus mirabilis]
MSNQNLEVLASALSAQVERQGQQIAELQKQLASMQLTSCELEVIKNTMLMAISNNSIEIKESNGATTCQLKPF